MASHNLCASSSCPARRSHFASSSISAGSTVAPPGRATTSARAEASSRFRASRASAAGRCAGSSRGDLAVGGAADGAGVGPGQAVEAAPLVRRRRHAAPLVDERQLATRVGHSGQPGLPRDLGGVRRAPGIGVGGGAAQHRRHFAHRLAGADLQHGAVVRLGRHRLRQAAGQHRAIGPLRVGGHERRDIRRAGGTRRQQPEIHHQLARHRIGGGSRQRIGIRPAVLAQGGTDLVRLRGMQGRGEQQRKEGDGAEHRRDYTMNGAILAAGPAHA